MWMARYKRISFWRSVDISCLSQVLVFLVHLSNRKALEAIQYDRPYSSRPTSDYDSYSHLKQHSCLWHLMRLVLRVLWKQNWGNDLISQKLILLSYTKVWLIKVSPAFEWMPWQGGLLTCLSISGSWYLPKNLWYTTKLTALDNSTIPHAKADMTVSTFEFAERFGTSFMMIKSDINGNITRLETARQKDPQKFNLLFSIVLDEVQRGQQGGTYSDTKGLLWLKR